MFNWFRYLNIENEILTTRKTLNFELANWVIFNFPDGLWIFSYVMLMLKIWNFKLNFESVFWVFAMPIIAIFSEILQFFKIIPGTFDFWDLNFYFFGSFLPLILNRKIIFNLKYINYEQKL